MATASSCWARPSKASRPRLHSHKLHPKNRKGQRNRVHDGRGFPPDYTASTPKRASEHWGSMIVSAAQVWTDEWATDARWQSALRALKAKASVRSIGSAERWQRPKCAGARRGPHRGGPGRLQRLRSDPRPVVTVTPENTNRDHRPGAFDKAVPDSMRPTRVAAGDFRNLISLRTTGGDAAPSCPLREVVPSGMTIRNWRCGTSWRTRRFRRYPRNASVEERRAEPRGQRWKALRRAYGELKNIGGSALRLETISY